MKNQEKLISAFVEALGVDEKSITLDLEYDNISEWDSVGHMSLIAEIEDIFDIMIDNEDIIDMNSMAKIKDVLLKYEVKF